MSAIAEKSALTTERARFHLSLNVGNLDRSIEFFRSLLGCEPAKCRPDYAKFELDDPPLVLSLEPYAAPPGGNLNHLGFRVETSAALVEVQRRLELGGISTVREEGVECCYARQTKFWVHDPDGNMWEIYTLDEDIEHRGDGQLPVIQPTVSESGEANSVWNHRLGQAFPERLPILDGTVDIAGLQGTLNEKLLPDEQERRLREVLRVLKPGGKVQMHILTADRAVDDAALHLPGPAAAVQHVPIDEYVLMLLTRTGFEDAKYTLRAKEPCFRVGPAELRETRIEATKP
jgi:catechol 2,3-dioxygenase-like lactoylglutathione lyase family enzyme